MGGDTVYTIPNDLVSVANYLFTDPTTNTPALPWLNQMVDYLRGQDINSYEPIDVYGHTVRRYDQDLKPAQALFAGDMSVLPFLSWFGNADPRAELAAAAAPYANLDANMLEAGPEFNDILGGIAARAAMQHKLGGLGVAQTDIDRILNTVAPMQGGVLAGGVETPRLNLATGSYQSTGPYDHHMPGVAKDDPLRPYMDELLGSLNAPYATNGTQDPNDPYRRWDPWDTSFGGVSGYGAPLPTDINADLTNGSIRQSLSQSGVTVPPLNPIGTTTTGGTVATSDNTGVQPTPLNYFAPFLAALAGGYPGLDDAGNPTWTQLTPDQWEQKYGTSGLFGGAQYDDIKNLLTPLPLSEQEQVSRDLTSTDPAKRAAAMEKLPQLQQAMNNINNVVLPGLTDLAQTGFRTPTPNLYTQPQYQLAEQLARTGNRQGLEDAASTWMNRRVAPQLAARFGAQLGSSGSDFGGELLNQANLFSADIADRVSQNQITGQGLWGDMTSSQGLLDSQLGEAAAARRANALPLLGTWSSYANQLPLAFATDLSNFGGANRQTDELLRPGRVALGLYNQLLTGANPSNLGYVAQGQLPSAGASYLNGLAGQSASFSGSSLAGLLPGLSQGLGNLGGSLLSNVFSGGGFDNNGNMGILGDLGGLIGGLGSSLWSGIGSLFGGGGGSSNTALPGLGGGYYSGPNYNFGW